MSFRPTIVSSEKCQQNGPSPLWCSNRLKALASYLFPSLAGHRKKLAFRTQHLTAAMSPRLTGHGSWQNVEDVCSTERRSSLPSLRALGCLSRCLEWDMDVLSSPASTFCDSEHEAISDRKKYDQNWVRLPRLKGDLNTQITYEHQTWQRESSSYSFIHSRSFVVIHILWDKDSRVVAVKC